MLENNSIKITTRITLLLDLFFFFMILQKKRQKKNIFEIKIHLNKNNTLLCIKIKIFNDFPKTKKKKEGR